MKILYTVLKESIINTINHDGVEYAGYLAFLWLFSLFPFLFFFATIAGHAASLLHSYPYDIAPYEITKKLISLFINNVPENIVEGILPYIHEILAGPPQGLLTLAILGAIWTASSTIEGMKSTLNKAANYQGNTGFSNYLIRRFFSILQFILITFILLLFLVAKNILLKIHYFQYYLDVKENLETYFLIGPAIPWPLSYFISTVFLFISISLLYLILPDKKQPFYSVVPGALIVVILWILASNLFSLYIKYFAAVNIIYGSITGIIIILLFFYILNLCFIYGAELNYCIEKYKVLLFNKKLKKEE